MSTKSGEIILGYVVCNKCKRIAGQKYKQGNGNYKGITIRKTINGIYLCVDCYER